MSEKSFSCCECCAAGVDADTHAWAGKDWHEVDCDACNGYRFSREEYLALIAAVERAAAEKAWDECLKQMPFDLDWKIQYGDLNPYRREEA